MSTVASDLHLFRITEVSTMLKRVIASLILSIVSFLSFSLLMQTNIHTLCAQSFEDFAKKRFLTFTISIEKEEYLFYEPINIHCVLENPTSDSIPGFIPVEPVYLPIYVIDTHGDTVCCKNKLCVDVIYPDTEPYIEPHGSRYVPLNIDDRLDPGNYTLQVKCEANLIFYSDLYKGYSRKDNEEEYLAVIHRLRSIGRVISNKLTFRVICPQGEIDEKAYELLERSQEEAKYRRGKEYHKHFDAMEELLTTYPDHPYALREYPIYLSHLISTDYDKNWELIPDLAAKYPNSRFSRELIDSDARMFISDERNSYFDKLKSQYKGQWIEMYVLQQEKRYNAAEARGWHPE